MNNSSLEKSRFIDHVIDKSGQEYRPCDRLDWLFDTRIVYQVNIHPLSILHNPYIKKPVLSTVKPGLSTFLTVIVHQKSI